jgi:hypothetical protein
MTLDRSKKYEGLGLTLHRDVAYWAGYDSSGKYMTADDEIMQSWLDAGHIRPVKEKKIVRAEGCRIVMGYNGQVFVRGWDSFKGNHLVPMSAEAKPVTLEFEVDA